MGPEVSVVIPAYNAGATLPDTLASVCAQTVRAIEILVIDDGSTDDTSQVVRAAAKKDGRVRLLRQANAGVAAARNAGIAAARAAFVAPVDADDLWHATNLERKLAVFRRVPEAGLVYSGFRLIDAHGHVIKTTPRYRLEGWVYARAVAHNIVGNGSAIMFRREAALAVGGYDPRLRRAGVEGCEDYLFQIQIARRYPFGVDPLPLIGYRKRRDAMSADVPRMLRSRILALQLLEAEGVPALTVVREARAAIRVALALAHARKGHLAWALEAVGRAALDAPPARWSSAMRHGAGRTLRNRHIGLSPPAADPSVGLRFLDLPPEEAVDIRPPAYLQRTLDRLAAQDEALRGSAGAELAASPQTRMPTNPRAAQGRRRGDASIVNS
jgi:hypothetical protein